MCNCNKCIRQPACQKARYFENYKIKSGCSDFIDGDLYKLLQELTTEQIGELIEFADSLRKNRN